VNALSLYEDLKGRGVSLVAQGDLLKVDAPAGVLTEQHRAALKKFKPKLLRLLSRPPQEEALLRSEARWAGQGRIRIHDPFTGQWHEWPADKCLPGVVAEADRLRKAPYERNR